MNKIFNIYYFVFLITMGLAAEAVGQSDSLPSLKSPYHAVLTHLHFLQADNYAPAKSAMVIPPAYRDGNEQKDAVRLKRIMDGRGLYVLMSELPAKQSYTDSTSDRHVYTLFPKRLPAIYLERIDGRWYYSEETMDRLDQLYEETFPYGVDRLVDMFPAHEGKHFLGLSPWQWLGLPVLLILSFLVYWLARWILRPVVALIRRLIVTRFPLQKEEMSKIVHLLGLIAALRLIQIFLPALQLPVKFAEFLIILAKIGQTVFVVWLIIKVVDVVNRYLEEVVSRTESKVDDQLLPIIIKTFKILIIVGGLVQIMRLFGVNVAAIIAGLSLGGLALALAAQDTVKNFIGSLMIIMDRPFQVGDYVSVDGLEGTVVEVGFRTSRVQKVDFSVISIPNGQLADARVTNLGVRPRRMISMKLGVQYNTPPEKIEEFIAGIKQIVIEHPQTANEPLYVFLNDFAASSIDVFFRCYIEVLTYPEELQVREEVLFKVLRLANSIGVSFAFPSTSLYVETLPEKAGDL